MKNRLTLDNIFVNILKIMGLIAVGVLFVMNILLHSEISADAMEHSVIGIQSIGTILAFAVFALLMLFVGKFLDKITAKKLFLICSLIYVVAGLFIIFSTEVSIRADQLSLFKIAQALNAGDYSVFNIESYMTPGDTVGYITHSPHQMGYITYERLLLAIEPTGRIIFVANLLWIILTNYFIWKITDIAFGKNETVNKYAILLTYLFLPQLFFIMYAYGQVPGMLCAVISLYGLLKYFDTEKIKYLVATVVFTAVSDLLRNNYMIFTIAIIAICFLRFVKKPNLKTVVVMVLLFVSMTVPSKLLIAGYENVSGIDISDGQPMISFVAMGLQESDRAPGWYNGYNWLVFEQSGLNTEIASEAAMENIKERLKFFASDPMYFVYFMYLKTVSMWCEPTFQSVWSGPSGDESIYSNSLVESIYMYGSAFDVVNILCNVVVLAILLFTLINLINSIKNKNHSCYQMFFIIYLFGGLIFHTFWEAKSQYVYTFIMMLIPLAANGLSDSKNIIEKFKNNRIKEGK